MTIFEGPTAHVEEGVGFTELILENFQQIPDDTVLLIASETDEHWTKSRIEKSAASLASYLGSMGYGQHSMISLLSKNSPSMFIAYMGVLIANVPTAVSNPDYNEEDLKYFFNNNKAEMVLLQSEYVDKVESIRSQLPHLKHIFIIEGEKKEGYQHLDDLPSANLKDAFVPIENQRESVALILYSSGTTGWPKGVMISHLSLYNYVSLAGFKEDIKGLSALALMPMFHILGLLTFFVSVTYELKVITMARFKPKAFLSAIEHYKIDLLTMVPAVVQFLNKSAQIDDYDLSSVKMIGCGGASIGSSEIKTLMERTKWPMVFHGYAMTEGFSMTVGTTGISWKDGSVGKLGFNTKGKIIDPDTKEVKGPNEEGEILIQSPAAMIGYLNNPKATAETIDEEGWLHTGDIGYFDEEGFLFIVDRCKELIKFKGFQVAPAKLEALLMKDERVLDAAVIGKPDTNAGELPMAIVVKKDPSVTEEDLTKLIDDQVSANEKLRGGVIFVDSLPRTSTGKILRRQLRAELCPK